MSLIPLACFFTGHRVMEETEEAAILTELENSILSLVEKDVKVFICGGALGFDTLAAETVLKLKKSHDITLCLYLPCVNQTEGWLADDVARYNSILESADEVYYTSKKSKSPELMKKRNKAMVEAADFGICYLKNEKSGTAQTVRFAHEKGIEVINLYKNM